MVETEDIELTCNYYKNKWSINLKDLMSIPDKIELYFTSTGVPADTLIKEFEYIAPSTEYSEPYYTFTIPIDGMYKIETWGASGGNSGGYGGYSVGTIYLEKNKNIYVYIAGQSGTSYKGTAGYNGGEVGYSSVGNCDVGGGATHIAYQTGLLSTLSSSKNSILIVSGGGGGKCKTAGGNVGGYIGTGSNPGSQTSGKAFGKGAGITSGGNQRGGGGYYGGGHADNSSGSGGSSYIGNSLLTNKAIYCYRCKESIEETTYTIETQGGNERLDKTNCPNGYSAEPISKCAKSGNGYARITFVNDAN